MNDTPALSYFPKPCFKLVISYSQQCHTGTNITARKMKFSIKCGHIRSFLRIWSHLLKKSLTERIFFCAVYNLLCAIVI